MREILFRGKDTNNNWVEGDFLQYLGCGKVHIAQNYKGAGGREVIPETVGQYTGFTDKNGKKIFEGDILKFPSGNCYPVWWDADYKAFGSCYYRDFDYLYQYRTIKIEVIGNIHDNPELLEGASNE